MPAEVLPGVAHVFQDGHQVVILILVGLLLVLLSVCFHLQRRVQQAQHWLKTLIMLSQELAIQSDSTTLLKSIVMKATGLVRCCAGGVCLYQSKTHQLEVAVITEGSVLQLGATFEYGDALPGQVWVSRHAQVAQQGNATMLGVPIELYTPMGETFLGVLFVEARSTHTFTPADCDLLSLFANQAAIAIRNAQLLESERQQREMADALTEATAVINSTLNLESVLDRILEQVERVVRGDACNMMLVEDQLFARVVRVRGYEALDANESHTQLRLADFFSLSEMRRTRRPLLISDTRQDPRWVMRRGQSWLRSYIGAPIVLGAEEVVGFLNVDGINAEQFNAEDMHWLQAFAGQAAFAIQHARLYDALQVHATTLEQHVAERTLELQQHYARLDAILRSAASGIVVADAAGGIREANPVAQAWLTQTLSPEDARRMQEALITLAQHPGAPGELLLELTGLDLELRAAPVAAQSDPTVVINIHDVSHLKALERMKTRFITDISHELRTPTTAIKLYVHLLRERPEQWAEYWEALAAQVEHQAQLLQAIQEIAHFDAGRVELRPYPTRLLLWVSAIVETYQPLAVQKQIRLSCIERESPQVQVDAERLMQALDNLLLNALHYTLPGGQIVLSTGVVQAQERRWAIVEISDSGIGIPEDELPHIFERFFRGARAQLLHPGSGLGLSIAQQIVGLHGGHISVSQTGCGPQGEGSTFTVWVPVCED